MIVDGERLTSFEAVSLDEAREQGLKYYFSGLPCAHGHICKRQVANRVCVECSKIRLNEWRNKNKDRVKEHEHNWRISNKAELQVKWKNRYPLIRERHLANTRRWRSENKDLALAACRTYYLANKDKIAKGHSEWCKKNVLKCRSYVAKRRSQAVGSFSEGDIREIRKHQREKCAYYGVCGKSLRDKYHIDHIVALSNGGSNFRSNLQLLCPRCNHTKHNKDPIVFSRQLGMLL